MYRLRYVSPNRDTAAAGLGDTYLRYMSPTDYAAKSSTR